MGQATLKAARRAERAALVEAIVQAHDRLHDDDVEGCHAQLHHALGIDESYPSVAPLAHLVAFDAAFRNLCLRHGRRAYYVVVDTTDANGTSRLVSGGDADLVEALDRRLRRP